MKPGLNLFLWSLLAIIGLSGALLAYGWTLYARLGTADIGQDFNQAMAASIPADKLGNSFYCGHCHTQIFQEWSASLHRFSSHNNPVYHRVTQAVRQQGNPEHLRFCARCHEPMMLAAGEDLTAEPQGWIATAGLSCLSCHRITEVHGGNGQYVLQEPILHLFAVTESPLLQAVHAALVNLFPGLHREMLTQDFYASAEYCRSCHEVTVPKAINGVADVALQDEYHQWRHGPFASGRDGHPQKDCLTCHMPYLASDDPAAQNGLIRSHRFVGGNNALPQFNRDFEQAEATEQFLRAGRIALDIAEAEWAAGGLNLDLILNSQDIGHAFPAGTADSNQAWLEIIVRDAQGNIVAHQGGLDAERRIDPDAVTFGIDYADAGGAKTDRRTTTTEAVAILRDTRLGPGERRRLRISIELTASPTYPLTVEAKLNWRKYAPDLIAWVFAGRDAPDIPVTVMSSDEFLIETH